jgi:hypothetical protein
MITIIPIDQIKKIPGTNKYRKVYEFWIYKDDKLIDKIANINILERRYREICMLHDIKEKDFFKELTRLWIRIY